MKTANLKTSLVLMASLLGGSVAWAQTQSNGIPGPEDYASFSRFITDRNIFDPTRQPHDYNSHRVYRPTRTRTPRGTPGIQLVGTMNYQKGLFAFFSGTSDELNKVAQNGQAVAGYTVTAITPDSVTLESADKKDQIDMKIGDGFRQENNKWIFAKSGEVPTESTPAPDAASASSSDNSSSSSAPPAAPAPSATEQNDVLKRLMQQREKENQ